MKKIILYHNNKTYHLSYNPDQTKNIVCAMDYMADIKLGDEISLKMIYDSESGIINKDIKGICVSEELKGIKKTSFKFKRRQNYSRTVGFSAKFTGISIEISNYETIKTPEIKTSKKSTSAASVAVGGL